jgi:tRNA G10  N-methylase Trm11
VYWKSFHAAALESAKALRADSVQLVETHRFRTGLFRADARDKQALGSELRARDVDVVITDVPYGRHSAWQGSDLEGDSTVNPLWQMLDSLLSALSPTARVAVASNKERKPFHKDYQRLERFRLGKRHAVFLTPSYTRGE